jgi:hypothetical protein
MAVSLWMAVAGTITFWLWKSRQLAYVFGLNIALVAISMIAICILCKSANGWSILLLGCSAYYLYNANRARKAFLILSLMIPGYIFLRLSGVLSADAIEALAAKIFDYERAASLGIRLYQEEVFGLKALQRPIFGWGGHGRGWPIDPVTGELMVQMIDALWLGILSSKGLLGLISYLGTMLAGPWMVFNNKKLFQKNACANHSKIILLALVVVFFIIDSLFNGMLNPVFILITAALISWQVAQNANSVLEKEDTQ